MECYYKALRCTPVALLLLIIFETQQARGYGTCSTLKYRVIALDYIKIVALIFIMHQKISRKFLIL